MATINAPHDQHHMSCAAGVIAGPGYNFILQSRRPPVRVPRLRRPGGIVAGFLIPSLSAIARPYLAVGIFLFTFGSFLKLHLESFRNQFVHTRATFAMVLWATFGVPIAVLGIITLFKPGADVTQRLLFWSLVPTSPACVAFSAILGLSTPLALLATVAATAASPFYMPWLAAVLGGYQLTINPGEMSLHLLLIVGGARVAAFLVKRFAAKLVRDNPDAMTGIAVFALVLAGLGSMPGRTGPLRQPTAPTSRSACGGRNTRCSVV
jgi:predicted Na+-dependent transporter